MARAFSWFLTATVALSQAGMVGAQGVAPPQPLPPAPQPSPLLIEPTTPEELFSSVLLLVELGRFDLAGKYLTQFAEGEPTDELLIKLRDEHGTGSFLRLSRIPELQPAGKAVLDRLNRASRGQVDDPAFVEGMIARLTGNSTEREIAYRELRNAGPRAVPQMLRVLATTPIEEQRDAISLALVRMGRQVVPALIGALESPHELVRMAAIDGLRLLDAKEAIPYLWRLAFSEAVTPGTRLQAKRAIAALRTGSPDQLQSVESVTALQDLRTRAEEYFTRVTLLAPENEVERTLTRWSWDPETDLLVGRTVDVGPATLAVAQRLARDALDLAPERPELQRLALNTTLALEVQNRGWAEPLPITAGSVLGGALTTGLPLLTDSLRQALTWGRTDAAWAILTAMKHIPTRELVRTRDGLVSPVILALNYPDVRIQFEAAMVVLRSEPTTEFAGSRRVVQILRRALTDPGQARAMVIDADRERGIIVGGYLNEQGFEGLAVATGKQGFQQAAELAGIDLIVIHVNAVDWALSQTIANLRADARTSSIPIIIYGPEDTRNKMTRLIKRTGLATYVSESSSADDFWGQARPFLSGLQAPPLTQDERREHRVLATYWLATIATSKNSRLFDITDAERELIPLIDDEELAPNLIVALGAVPTAEVQTRLTEFALNPNLPIETRTRAADQLTAHIQRHGLLLSKDQVRLVNAAQEADESPVIQAALAPVLGTFQPNAGLTGQRLQRLGR
ncbi:MAG TPA: HEAT repeat domain-containing protein [Planctomycetaceae bacterium]|nr:HEAT repeat domain-containing protein [Planctomycetaceae bacterium]